MRMRILSLLLIMILVFTGCYGTPQGKSSGQTDGKVKTHAVKKMQDIPPKPAITEPGQVALRLERLAVGVPLVQAAHCVVLGNTAIVGIDVPPNLDRARIGTIKYSVAEALRKDVYGVHAIVTADMDLSHRLMKIRDSMAAGQPITGFADELANIIGRIMPQLPQDIKPLNHQSGSTNGSQKPIQNNL